MTSAFNIFIQHTSALARAGNPAAVKTLKNLLARPVSRNVSNSLSRAGVPRAFAQQYTKDKVALQTLMNTVEDVWDIPPLTINASLAILRRRYVHPDTVRVSGGSTLLKLVVRIFQNFDIAIVRELVALGADVDAVDKNGDSVLITAAAEQNVSIVSFLVRCGARVNAVNRDGRTAVNLAIQFENTPVVKYFIGIGATISSKDLHEAAVADSIPICKLLLDRGLNVNFRDEQGHTALVDAADLGHIDVVKYLLRRGTIVKPSDVQAVLKMREEFGIDENNMNDDDREIMRLLQNAIKKRKR